jgi:hypothetical protein
MSIPLFGDRGRLGRHRCHLLMLGESRRLREVSAALAQCQVTKALLEVVVADCNVSLIVSESA